MKYLSDEEIKSLGDQWKEALGMNPYRLYANLDFAAGATCVRDQLYQTKPLSEITEQDAIELIQLWMFDKTDLYPVKDFNCHRSLTVFVVVINNDWFKEEFRIGLKRGALWCSTNAIGYKVHPGLYDFLKLKKYKI
jgi:hypothetical protein